MTHYHQTIMREFSVITEETLTGSSGQSFGVGGTFVYTSANAVLSVTDNDSRLAGDAFRNERGNDRQGGTLETASGEVNVGNVYAESVHVLIDSNHNYYFLVEIEGTQLSNDLSKDDLFTFFGHVPDPGTSLTAVATFNVYHGLNYGSLGAGVAVGGDLSIAVADSFDVGEDGGPVSLGNLLANDELGSANALVVAAVDGSPLVVGVWVDLADGGRVLVATDGSIQFDADGDFEALAQGEVRDVSFTYTAANELGRETEASVIVSVTGVNDVPIVSASLSASAAEGNVGFSLDLLDGASDADNGDTETLTVQNVTGLVAGLTLSSTTLTADPQDAAFQRLSAGESRVITVRFDVVDARGASVPQTVSITITGTNDGPTLTAGTGAAAEDGEAIAVDLSLLGDDVDSDDDGTTLSYAVSGPPGEGSASISGTTLGFDPGTDFQDLALGETRDVIIQVTATDAHGATAVNDVVVTVTGTNDAPTLDFGVSSALDFATAAGVDRPAAVWLDDSAGGYVLDESLGLEGGNGDVAIGDLDGDGDNDLFFVRSYASDGAFLNDGTGSFTNTGQTLGAFGGNSVELADVDADGDLDAVVANNFGGGRIWVNDGNATFSDQSLFAGFRYRDVAVADFDGDGDLDIAGAFTKSSTAGGGGVIIGTQETNGSFSTSNFAPSDIFNMVGLEVGDFDSDGDIDIFAAATSSGYGGSVAQHLLMLNDGVGNFTVAPQALLATGTQYTASGDFDGDGDIDVAIVDASNQLTVLENSGAGTFSEVTYSLIELGLNIESVDFDGDGTTDIAVSSFDTLSIFSLAEGGFTEILSQSAVGRIRGMEFGDLNASRALLEVNEDGSSATLDLAALGADVDSDDDGTTLSYAVTGPPIEGAATINGTTLTFDPGAEFQDLADGEARDVIVQITATDAHGATAVNDVVVSVTGTNDAPDVVAIDAGFVSEDDPSVSINLLAGQTDIDSGSALAVINPSVSDDLGNSVAFVDNGDGTVTVDPTQYDALNDGQARTVTIAYEVTDGMANTANTATFVIEGVTDQILSGAQNDVFVKSDSSRLNFVNLFSDNGFGPDLGVGLEIVNVTGETLTAFSFGAYDYAFTMTSEDGLQSGVLFVDTNGRMDFTGGSSTQDEGDIAVYRFDYTAEDDFGIQSTATVTINEIGENDGPSYAGPSTNFEVNDQAEDFHFFFPLFTSGSFGGGEALPFRDPEGDSVVSVVIDDLPTNGIVTYDDGTLLQIGDVLTPDAIFDLRFAPVDISGANQTSSLVYTLIDARGAQSENGTAVQFTVTDDAVDGSFFQGQTGVGGATNDVMTGRGSQFGSGGDDQLTGSSANQVLSGGSGDDILTGSSGTELFIIEDGTETDTIIFASTIDLYDISEFGFATIAELEAATTEVANPQSTLSGTDLVIQLDTDDQLILADRDLAFFDSLSEDNFIF